MIKNILRKKLLVGLVGQDLKLDNYLHLLLVLTGELVSFLKKDPVITNVTLETIGELRIIFGVVELVAVCVWMKKLKTLTN